ncbi:type I restriction enzyme EcoKI subunit R [compost metagenome]
MIPMAAETTYRRTLETLRLANPKLVCIGLTATPYRMKGGHLTECGLFNHIACDFGSREYFVRFVNEGYLAKLTVKETDVQFDLSDVGDVAGEFNQGQLAEAVDKHSVTVACCHEMLRRGHDRKKWLIFAASIEHAEHISEVLNDLGVPTDVVHSKMTKDRKKVIGEFKREGGLRALVNMGVLTTGFDFPGIDMLVGMRPTKSIPLHIQMGGRGTRPVFAPGFDLTTIQGRLAAIAAGSKSMGCLWLDFAGNILRLGPINDPYFQDKKKKKKGSAPDGPPVRVCPKCQSYNAIRARNCEDCGHEFPPPVVDVSPNIADAPAVAGMEDGKPQQLTVLDVPVDMVKYSLYHKPGKPPSIRAVYHCGMTTYSSWLCFEHKGSARGIAYDWWKKNTENENYPTTCEEFLGRSAELQKPVAIRLWVKKPHNEILCALYQNAAVEEEVA